MVEWSNRTIVRFDRDAHHECGTIGILMMGIADKSDKRPIYQLNPSYNNRIIDQAESKSGGRP